MNARPLFLYDGDCGVCEAVVHRLAHVLGDSEIRWQPWQEASTLPPGLSPTLLDRWAFLVLPDGRQLRGFLAFRALALRLPGWRNIAWLALLPPLSWAGSLGYFLFARHRRSISVLLGLRACRLRARKSATDAGDGQKTRGDT
jgi:predicted DCC family thiol-disulfide oxidoreductase YuxK